MKCLPKNLPDPLEHQVLTVECGCVANSHRCCLILWLRPFPCRFVFSSSPLWFH